MNKWDENVRGIKIDWRRFVDIYRVNMPPRLVKFAWCLAPFVSISLLCMDEAGRAVVLPRVLLGKLGAVTFIATGYWGRGRLVDCKVYRDSMTDSGCCDVGG